LNQKTTVLLNRANSSGVTRRAAAVLAGLMIAWALPASANTIGIKDGTLILGAEPGDGNQEYLVEDGGPNLAFWVFSNLDAAIVTPGCFQVGERDIECQKTDVAQMILIGGDGNDFIDVSDLFDPLLRIQEFGGAGNDTLIGGSGEFDIRLYGDAGDDQFVTTLSNCVSTGTGNDTVITAHIDCTGPEPDFKPLPRQAVATPEPGGFMLLGAGLVALTITSRMRIGRGLTKWTA
jgi:hypothetical protein